MMKKTIKTYAKKEKPNEIISPIDIGLIISLGFSFLAYVFIVFFIISICILFLLCYIWIRLNKDYLKNAPNEYNIKGENKYVGIVATTSNLPRENYFFVYCSGIILLIEHLKSKQQPFKLLNEHDEGKKFDKQKFRDMVNDPNCTELYILGHGRRCGLRISENELYHYFLLAGAPKKDKVIQLHCNHKGYRSLTELLHAQADFKQDSLRFPWQNIYYFLRKIR
jgi:hypothetical protein